MLVHHDQRDYATASKEAAVHAAGVIEDLIRRGLPQAEETLNRLEKEQPVDQYFPSHALHFMGEGKRVVLNGNLVHRHALVQIGERIGLPSPTRATEFFSCPKYIEPFSEILNQGFKHKNKVYLTRTVDNEVRGFLSDKYRRLDSRPVIEALVKEATALGAVPIKAEMLPTKIYLKMMLPKVFEPVANEILSFGLVFQNSDYGDGALSMRGFMYRLWCTNLAMCEDTFRQVHLGKKVSGLDVDWSARTYELDTETTVSMVSDVAKAIFSEEVINKKLEAIKEASTKEVDAASAVRNMKDKSKISKDESEKLAELYNSADIRKLPPGQTAWRLSNALSLLAQSCESARSLELEDLAGKVAGLQ